MLEKYIKIVKFSRSWISVLNKFQGYGPCKYGLLDGYFVYQVKDNHIENTPINKTQTLVKV